LHKINHLAGERSLHTGEVVGSIPTAPTIFAEQLGSFRQLDTERIQNTTRSTGGKSVESDRRLFLEKPPPIPKESPGAVVAATGAKNRADEQRKLINQKSLPNARERLAESELLEAWRAVANAKLKEYRHQARRLAQLVARGIVPKSAAIDRLWEIATAHALVRSLTEDGIQDILNEAFAGSAFHPMRTETVA
jgi:hypothetical protein